MELKKYRVIVELSNSKMRNFLEEHQIFVTLLLYILHDNYVLPLICNNVELTANYNIWGSITFYIVRTECLFAVGHCLFLVCMTKFR